MAINSRVEFAEYCLRKLGKPVININVAPEQVEDRIDEAMQVWREKHFDATEKEWMGYMLTADDVTRGYIILPEDIHIVNELIPMSTIYRDDKDRLFSYKHQFMITNLSPFQPLDMTNYFLQMTSLNEVNDMVNTTERFEFTKHKRKLHIYNNTKNMTVGEILCIHVYKYIDAEVNTGAWNDKWFKAYATALIKQQFGQNMKKHGEIQLLGGVSVNGQQIYDEAVAEIEQLEVQLRETYEEPINFFVG